MSDGEWRWLRSHRHADYTILKIREDLYRSPKDGREHPRVVLDVADWVNVVALTPDDRLVLVRQFRAGIAQTTLELPGGLVDPGEAPLHAATRELEEETGYRAARWVPLGFAHPNPAWQNNRAFSFFAEGCERVHWGQQDEGEDIQVELLPRAELSARLRDGTLTHSVVLGGILLAQAHGLLRL